MTPARARDRLRLDIVRVAQAWDQARGRDRKKIKRTLVMLLRCERAAGELEKKDAARAVRSKA